MRARSLPALGCAGLVVLTITACGSGRSSPKSAAPAAHAAATTCIERWNRAASGVDKNRASALNLTQGSRFAFAGYQHLHPRLCEITFLTAAATATTGNAAFFFAPAVQFDQIGDGRFNQGTEEQSVTVEWNASVDGNGDLRPTKRK